MNIPKIALAGALLILATSAQAQSVSSRVTSTVAGVTGSASAGVGTSSGSSSSNPYAALGDTGSAAYSGGGAAGGEVPGGVGVRVGGKTVVIRGAVGVGDDHGAFKAGAGIPF